MNLFITGCDSNTEWQLPWFWKNYKEHNDTVLIPIDFGMSDEMREWCKEEIGGYKTLKSNAKGWFKKPFAMLLATETIFDMKFDKVCWLDTDCQVMGDISGIFEYTQPHKICMVEDRPWTRRRGELGAWYNSGVVAFEDKPSILKSWANECLQNPVQGDQEVLYMMMNGDEILKMAVIEPLPHKYNTLRLDYLDGIAVRNPLIVHHTGKKGKEVIKEMMNE